MRLERLMERLVAVFALIALLGGALVVVAPFFTSLIWGAILTYSTWGPYMRLTAALGGRRGWSTLLMVLLILFLVLAPVFYAGFTFATHIDELVGFVQRRIGEGMPSLPDWVVRLPVLGPRAAEAWEEIGMHNPAVMSRLQEFSGAVAMTGFGAALGVMRGLGLLALSVLFASLFYLGGENAAAGLLAGMQRIVGARAAYLLALVGKTVNGVVYGILGTSIVQGALCGVGYWIAGLPSPILLSWITAFLAVIPGGPILIVLPGALWLAHVGHLGWGIFLVAWAVVVGVFSDNVLKPVLIGKSSRVPVILVMMGVLGGALAFGFLGAFIGPTLLAVAHAVLRQWAMGEPPPADGEMVPVADPRPRN